MHHQIWHLLISASPDSASTVQCITRFCNHWSVHHQNLHPLICASVCEIKSISCARTWKPSCRQGLLPAYMVWYGHMVWYGMVVLDTVWYGMVFYDMIWYTMVWDSMVQNDVSRGSCQQTCRQVTGQTHHQGEPDHQRQRVVIWSSDTIIGSWSSENSCHNYWLSDHQIN